MERPGCCGGGNCRAGEISTRISGTANGTSYRWRGLAAVAAGTTGQGRYQQGYQLLLMVLHTDGEAWLLWRRELQGRGDIIKDIRYCSNRPITFTCLLPLARSKVSPISTFLKSYVPTVCLRSSPKYVCTFELINRRMTAFNLVQMLNTRKVPNKTCLISGIQPDRIFV